MCRADGIRPQKNARRFSFALAWLLLPICPARLDAAEYQWVLLEAQNDSRDPEVREQDAAWSLNMVAVMNQSEDLFRHHLVWKEVSIDKLLEMNVPFCEMHFDAVKPFWLTPKEKSILAEYFRRGGFILFFIDAYPYDQDEFWKVKQWPLIDFLRKELPRESDFTASRVNDDFPLFSIHYQAEVNEEIRHELDDNPNTPNRTGVFYRTGYALWCWVTITSSSMASGWPRPGLFRAISAPNSRDTSGSSTSTSIPSCSDRLGLDGRGGNSVVSKVSQRFTL